MKDVFAVDYDELETAIEQMRIAYEQFNTFSENVFQTEIECLSAMNSDFVDKLIRVLEIAKNWNIDTLNENILGYIQDAEAAWEDIKKTDEALAKAYQQGENKKNG